MDDPLVGKTLGKYKVEALIGQGAMAEVYRAFHPGLNRRVAIKRLHNFLVEKTEMLERFQREAQNIAALTHPNIVQVYDFDASESIYYMVMEYIEGQTLKQILSETGAGDRLPLREVIRVIHDVGAALIYAHSREVVHRDIKPANIMRDKRGRIVLTDFGLARLLSGPQYTSTGTIVGTPAYMSPEQGKGAQGDERADIYALGVMLFEMAVGRPPFTGESPVAVIFNHVTAPIPSARAENQEIPVELDEIIFRALAKDPEDRYQTASELVNDLESVDSRLESGELIVEPAEEKPFSLDELSLDIRLLDFGFTHKLKGRERYVLGRRDGAFEPDLDLGEYPIAEFGVSRLHAEIEVTPDGEILVHDMESTNGTWINGREVSVDQPARLKPGDIIGLGKCRLQIQINR